MSELLEQLGIDWKLLLSQGVNFLLLMAVLTFFIYRPLLKIMRQRREKIELGVKVGEEAEKRIAEAEKVKQQKISTAESRALQIIKNAEKEALKQKEDLMVQARAKSDELVQEGVLTAERKKLAILQIIIANVKELVREAIIKTVLLKPDQIDEKLIDQAVQTIKKEIK